MSARVESWNKLGARRDKYAVIANCRRSVLVVRMRVLSGPVRARAHGVPVRPRSWTARPCQLGWILAPAALCRR